jgi:hypothetical protein
MTADKPPGIGFAEFEYADYADGVSTTTEIGIPVGYHPTRMLVLRAAQEGWVMNFGRPDEPPTWCLVHRQVIAKAVPQGSATARILELLDRWGYGRTSATPTPFSRILDLFHKWGLVDSHGEIRPLGALVLDDWTLREADGDRSDCPYLRGTGDGKCNQGCWEEPRCVTDAPVNGWPMTRSRILRGDV